jgi:hypothetical protein
MTIDQAQSSRLGQRVAPESTYVQIFDVDPATPTSDLVEAAWPGMLIFRMDIGILQIFNGTAGAWQDVAGGVAGKLTYVGPDEPVESPPAVVFAEGDIWFDDDDGFKQYVWALTPTPHWEPVVAGIASHSQGANTDGTPPGVTIGDIWFNTDDKNRPYWWNGTTWLDMQNPSIQDMADSIGDNANNIGNNTLALQDLSTIVESVALTASSANNTADTADGRVSMSDYMPGGDDVAGRVNGSIWFTRTRPRTNVCTNPSFETNTSFWTFAPGVVAVRDSTLFVPAGVWTLKVTNGATGPFTVAWGQSAQPVCAEGQTFTASIYAELLSGSGANVVLEILWYDATATLIGTSTSDPFQLVLNAFDPSQLGTAAEPRLFVTDAAPAGAVSFYVRETNPNAGDVWHTGELLVEAEDDLGRYFDGDSFDGSWTDVPQNSTSELAGDKIIQIWELRDGQWIQKYLTEDTLYLINVAKLIGELDGSVSLQDNTVPVDKQQVAQCFATEPLTAGDLVNIWNNNGVFSVRKASATLRQGASGFVLDTVSTGVWVNVYHVGYNPFMTNLTPGAQWLSVTGQVSSRPPTAVGSLVQRVGSASTSTTLNFHPTVSVKIT